MSAAPIDITCVVENTPWPPGIVQWRHNTQVRRGGIPTTNGGMQKWRLSRNMYALRTRSLLTWRQLACSVGALATKFLRRRLGRKFTKSSLLVGHGREWPKFLSNRPKCLTSTQTQNCGANNSKHEIKWSVYCTYVGIELKKKGSR